MKAVISMKQIGAARIHESPHDKNHIMDSIRERKRSIIKFFLSGNNFMQKLVIEYQREGRVKK